MRNEYASLATLKPQLQKKIIMIAVAHLMVGCAAVGPNFQTPEAKVQTDWALKPSQDAQLGHQSAQDFWSSFNDPILSDMLSKAHSQNLNLKSAALAVAQANEIVRVGQAASYPSAQLQMSSNYTQPDLESKIKGKTNGSTTQQVGAAAAWELDFWGQITRSQESDLANLNVSRAAWGAARISLDANVASTYCNMRAQEQRLEVARSNLKAQTENTRIAEARYRLGSTSELDWQQSRTQLAQTQAQIPVLAYALAQYQHALSVLLGEPPDFVARNYSVVGYLPDAPQQALMVGAPKDLLRRRPDVLQAQYAAAAQSARIGQAEAALYPSFTLTGSFGYATTDASSLFSWDSRALAAGLGFNLPIFDRGKLKAQVRVQDILFNQSVLAYQNQVLKAQQEVEDALAALQANQQQLQDWRMADQAAARSTKLAMVRFISGQTDFTTVSSAEQAHLQTSDAVVQAQAGVLQAIISAYRALGGGWTGDLIQQQSTK